MTYDLKALQELEKRLGEAKAPDSELDALLWAEFDGRDVRDDTERQMLLAKSRRAPHDECVLGWYDPGKKSRNFSPVRDSDHGRYTGSIDAAVALVERVLPGASIHIHHFPGHEQTLGSEAIVGTQSKGFKKGHPALAICLALVRALISQGEP